jgi:hypothetical protein
MPAVLGQTGIPLRASSTQRYLLANWQLDISFESWRKREPHVAMQKVDVQV